MPTAPRFIDVHSHALPAFYVDSMRAAGMDTIDRWPFPQWTTEGAVAFMDELGIEAQMLSSGVPGLHFVQPAEAPAFARALNESYAAIAAEHPARFGTMAILPLPNVDASLDELAYALDMLHMDGVALLSNYDGVYLGDPKFDALFDELHRRETVVFVHPSRPPHFDDFSVGITAPLIEYPFDTTRMAVNLLKTGTIERCPGMKVIVSHGGGTIPFLYPRLAFALGADRAKLIANFYFDLTAATTPGQFAAVQAVSRPDRLLMGFDYPFMTVPMNAGFLAGFNSDAFTAQQRQAIARDNALQLFPQFAAKLRG